MAEQLPPDWAIEKAIVLGENQPSPSVNQVVSDPSAYRGYIAFARYIASKEEAPVDPLLIEAREIAADILDHEPTDCKSFARSCRDGSSDTHPVVRSTLRALRRGIEIGKAQA